MKNNVIEVGDTFGNWTVVDNNILPIYPNSVSLTRYAKGVLVRCPHGVEVRRNITSLRRGDTSGCVQCGSESKFKGVGLLSSSYVSSIKLGARKRGLSFTVTTEHLWNLFEQQHRQCKLSGLNITLDPEYSTSCRRGKKEITQTASLDRIDNTKGYVEGNVQWVHKWVNLMKSDHSQEYFVELCELIAKTRPSQPRTRVIARTNIEGIHRWAKCPIEEVDYLRNYHRHVFYIIGKAYVNHSDRDIEFIQLSHQIKQYLIDTYYSSNHNCCFFGDMSCEMLADEIATKFDLYECEVNEDGEGGSVVKNLG